MPEPESALFDAEPFQTSEPIDVELSAGRKLTLRNQADLDRGVHPATMRKLRAEGGTCGECAHHHAHLWHSRVWHKCDVHRLGQSHSAASDIRVGWPACILFAREATDDER